MYTLTLSDGPGLHQVRLQRCPILHNYATLEVGM